MMCLSARLTLLALTCVGIFHSIRSDDFTCNCAGTGFEGPTCETEVVNPGCVDVTVEIVTDFYGYETSWTLADSDLSTLMSGSENQYGDGQTYTDTACLPNDSYYGFTIFDSFGDGIESPGYYKVTAGGSVIFQGGNFGYSEYTGFALGSPAGPNPCGGCNDSPQGWYDSGGPDFGCENYYSYGSACADEGDLYANNGFTANMACCACGGGQGSECSTDPPILRVAGDAAAWMKHGSRKPGKGKKKDGDGLFHYM